MTADKVSIISTDKVFRRVKDVVDLYYMSKVFDFNTAEVIQTLIDSGRNLYTFNGFLHRANELEHSYENFCFVVNVSKLPFEKIYDEVKAYLKNVLLKEKHRDYKR